jgi:hypothetical protein
MGLSLSKILIIKFSVVSSLESPMLMGENIPSGGRSSDDIGNACNR